MINKDNIKIYQFQQIISYKVNVLNDKANYCFELTIDKGIILTCNQLHKTNHNWLSIQDLKKFWNILQAHLSEGKATINLDPNELYEDDGRL